MKVRVRERENPYGVVPLFATAGEGGRGASGGRRSRRIGDVRWRQQNIRPIGRINDLINKAFLRVLVADSGSDGARAAQEKSPIC